MQFRCSITARRFPRLQDLKDDQIKALIIADRKKTGRVLPTPSKLNPKSNFKAAAPRRHDPAWQACQCPAPGLARWSPAGKFKGREDSMRSAHEVRSSSIWRRPAIASSAQLSSTRGFALKMFVSRTQGSIEMRLNLPTYQIMSLLWQRSLLVATEQVQQRLGA